MVGGGGLKISPEIFGAIGRSFSKSFRYQASFLFNVHCIRKLTGVDLLSFLVRTKCLALLIDV